MTTLQVVAVQNLAGRGHAHVRVFGYRPGDLNRRIMEVATNVADATDLITYAADHKAFPEIEVPDNAWIPCLNTGDMEMIHLKEPNA